MGLGFSLFLIAGGAILVWGVTGEFAGVDIDAIGWILVVVGIIGIVLSMTFWSSWGGFGGAARRRYAHVGHEEAGTRGQREADESELDDVERETE